MVPAQAPFPTASRFAFQFAPAGIHTSILISESDDGVSVAATRQKAARFAYGFPPLPARPPGAWNAPAATVSAVVMVAFLSFTSLTLSQPAASAHGAHNNNKIAAGFIESLNSYGILQAKFADSSIEPDPLYCAVCG